MKGQVQPKTCADMTTEEIFSGKWVCFEDYQALENRLKELLDDFGDLVKCPDCNGSGRFRYRYSEPSFNNDPSYSDFMSCILCDGKGFVEIDYLQKYHPEKLAKTQQEETEKKK